MFKNLFSTMFSKEKRKTTITAIVTIIVWGLMAVGILTHDQGEAVKSAWATIMNAIPGGDITLIFGSVAALIGQIYLIIVKDPKKPIPGLPGKK